MKQIIFFAIACILSSTCFSQTKKSTYPVPEYNNEVYLFKKDSNTLLRLEKGSSKQEMKMKMMGMGGMDQGYTLEGEASPVRLNEGSSLIFLYYNGNNNSGSSPASDSIMRANGMDPAMMNSQFATMNDPSNIISLYSMKSDKGNRKALLNSVGVMGKSKKSATKYTFSVRKVKEGYYELAVDKTLPKGEYTFVMSSMSMDQQFTLFAFGID